ncbi:T9SS type A sorting domain-containing protein [Marinoscillum sp.]|uniref:T9SS type A sorting domain-containing protein n=1 Tax=Marinoscillum sp. TaxID=2024838 RepID=UPI003BACF263
MKKALFLLISTCTALITTAQLSFNQEDPFYTGDSQNNYFSDYALSYDYNKDGINDLLHLQNNELYVLLRTNNGFGEELLVYSHEQRLIGFSNTMDLNNDEQSDFVINTNSEILIFEGTSDGIEHSRTLSEINSRYVHLNDLDGDGDIDIVFNDSFEIYFVQGNGDGSFSSSTNLTEGIDEIGSVFDFQIVDIEGDQDEDIVFLDLNNSRIHLLKNLDFTFSLDKSVPAGNTTFGVADFNMDGIQDLVLYSPENSLEVHVDQGEIYELTHTYNSYNMYAIVPYDYNSDGRKDILISCKQSSLELLTSNGDGTFQEPEEISFEIPKFENPRFADFNSDGIPDIIGMGLNLNQIVFLPLYPQISSNEVYTTVGLRPVPASNNSCQLGDLDNDGFKDLVIFSVNGGIYVFYGNRDGFDSEYEVYESHEFTNSGYLLDINNDGYVDIISTYKSASGSFVGSEKHLNLQDRSFNPPSPYKYLTSDQHVYFNDFNKDGTLEIITAFDYNIAFLRNDDNYDEYYSTVINPNLVFNSIIEDIQIQDINGDDWDDLIVSIYNAPEVKIFLNNQAGGFNSPESVVLEDDQFATSLEVIDLDSDGVKELIVATLNETNFIFEVKIFRRNSISEGFSPSETFSVNGNYKIVDIISNDFDNDGDIDLFLNEFDNLVSSFILNKEEGLELSYPGLEPYGQNHVIAQDIDSDELTDFIRISMSGEFIHIVRNNTVVEPSSSTTEILDISQEDDVMTITMNELENSGRIVIIKAESEVDAYPVDGTFYASNANFGIGSDLGNNNYVVYQGDGSEFNISGLNTLTDYYLSVFEYNTDAPNNQIINYLTSDFASTEFVLLDSQEISTTGIQDYLVSDESFTVSLTSNSDLPVEISLISGPVILDNNVFTITGTGEVVIQASQAGNKYYFPFERTYSLFINKEEQILSFENQSDIPYETGSFEILITATSGEAVALELISGPIELNGTTASIIGSGTVVISATQEGNQFYLPVTANFEFEILEVLGVSEIGSYVLYPNPTSDRLLFNHSIKDYRLRIVDMQGVMHELKVDSNYSINIENLKSGQYLLIMTNQKESTRIKIIKR